MQLFFNPFFPGFQERWGMVREKGFRWFYLHSAWRWGLFLLIIRAGVILLRRRFSLPDDPIDLAATALAAAAVMPPAQWKILQWNSRSQADACRRETLQVSLQVGLSNKKKRRRR